MTPDDPRLTARALGEGEGPLTPDESAEVEALRATADALRAGLAAEPVPALDPAHRGVIEAALASPAAPRPAKVLRMSPGLGVLAASLLLVVGFTIAGAPGGIEIGAQGPAEYVSNAGQGSVGVGYLGGGDSNLRYLHYKVTLPPGVIVATARTLPRSLLDLKRGNGPGPLDAVTNGLDDLLVDGKPSAGDLYVVDADMDGLVSGMADGAYRSLIENRDEGITGSTEAYDATVENAWVRPLGEAALSTFSIDVDTASYAVVRRCLMEQNRLPPRGAVRLEEMVNYFRYGYAPPAGADPLAVRVDAAACPWEPRHRLVRIALRAREVAEAERPPANLVFLLDVSGSMQQENKLPLVQKSVALLAERLTARDRVAIVTYAGHEGLALPSTAGDRKEEILGAIRNLGAGGSTNGGAGITLAYRVAEDNFVPGGINRVVLATDGDFNVGVTSRSDLVDLVKEKAKANVFLTALGFGMDNLKDSTLEALADRGNGNYGYVDNLREAEKVLVEEGMGTLHAVAKDVKLQVEFNPARVAAFRLVGYENRVLAAQDFADDARDAGEVGAGHCVTALYEVVPTGEPVPGAPVDALKYQRAGEGTGSGDLLTVKLRWKEPEGDASTAREFPLEDAGLAFDAAGEDFRFAAAVAEFALLLRGSEHARGASLDAVREIAASALGADPGGRRAEFLALVERAAALRK